MYMNQKCFGVKTVKCIYNVEMDTLFNDIPHLAALALKERKKQETQILELLTKIKE